LRDDWEPYFENITKDQHADPHNILQGFNPEKHVIHEDTMLQVGEEEMASWSALKLHWNQSPRFWESKPKWELRFDVNPPEDGAYLCMMENDDHTEAYGVFTFNYDRQRWYQAAGFQIQNPTFWMEITSPYEDL